ncbi:MAG: hypothetical protein SO031_07455, partial [Candidatus Ventricola sp.]|nr:hypothetical protein [Candidatus Ventricola sp.]
MKLIPVCLLLLCLAVPCALGETLSMQEMLDAQDAIVLMEETQAVDTPSSAAREDFIDRILSTAKSLYDAAGGRPQRAQYSGDIYVCKNFTVHLFRENCGDFRMAEFPDIPL